MEGLDLTLVSRDEASGKRLGSDKVTRVSLVRREGIQEAHTHTPVSLTGCLAGSAWTQLTVTVLDQNHSQVTPRYKKTCSTAIGSRKTPPPSCNVFIYGTLKWFAPFYAFMTVGLGTLGLRSHNTEVQGHCSIRVHSC